MVWVWVLGHMLLLHCVERVSQCLQGPKCVEHAMDMVTEKRRAKKKAFSCVFVVVIPFLWRYPGHLFVKAADRERFCTLATASGLLQRSKPVAAAATASSKRRLLRWWRLQRLLLLLRRTLVICSTSRCLSVVSLLLQLRRGVLVLQLAGIGLLRRLLRRIIPMLLLLLVVPLLLVLERLLRHRGAVGLLVLRRRCTILGRVAMRRGLLLVLLLLMVPSLLLVLLLLPTRQTVLKHAVASRAQSASSSSSSSSPTKAPTAIVPATTSPASSSSPPVLVPQWLWRRQIPRHDHRLFFDCARQQAGHMGLVRRQHVASTHHRVGSEVLANAAIGNGDDGGTGLASGGQKRAMHPTRHLQNL
jgi:hypothetical protein